MELANAEAVDTQMGKAREREGILIIAQEDMIRIARYVMAQDAIHK